MVLYETDEQDRGETSEVADECKKGKSGKKTAAEEYAETLESQARMRAERERIALEREKLALEREKERQERERTEHAFDKINTAIGYIALSISLFVTVAALVMSCAL